MTIIHIPVTIDSHIFTNMRSEAKYTDFLTEASKVKWEDVPSQFHWFCKMGWGYAGISLRQITMELAHNRVTNAQVRDLFTWLKSKDAYSFTFFWKNGDKRFRVAVDPFTCVEKSWYKKGIASTIQENESYISDIDLKQAQKVVFAELPNMRMNVLTQNESNIVSNNGDKMLRLDETLKSIQAVVETDITEYIKQAIDNALTFKIESLFVEMFTGLESWEGYSQHMMKGDVLEMPDLVTAFQEWLSTLPVLTHDFIDDDNKVIANKAISDMRKTMAECVIQLSLLKQRHIEMYKTYGIPIDTQEEE